MADETSKKVVKTVYTSALKVIYTIFLGIIIALFFGLGVAAFYPAPKAPEQPAVLNTPTKADCSQNAVQIKAQQEFDKAQKAYQEKFGVYNRNVSIITLVLAVLALTVGLLFLNKILLLSDGLLLGGVFTLIYSIIRGVMSENVQYRFLIVAAGLLITLILGYIKFIKPENNRST